METSYTFGDFLTIVAAVVVGGLVLFGLYFVLKKHGKIIFAFVVAAVFLWFLWSLPPLPEVVQVRSLAMSGIGFAVLAFIAWHLITRVMMAPPKKKSGGGGDHHH